jgi:hypothetical protein
MTERIEPLVRPVDAEEDREVFISLRVRRGTKTAIDELARKRGWTRSDTLRHLIGKGMEAEGIR